MVIGENRQHPRPLDPFPTPTRLCLCPQCSTTSLWEHPQSSRWNACVNYSFFSIRRKTQFEKSSTWLNKKDVLDCTTSLHHVFFFCRPGSTICLLSHELASICYHYSYIMMLNIVTKSILSSQNRFFEIIQHKPVISKSEKRLLDVFELRGAVKHYNLDDCLFILIYWFIHYFSLNPSLNSQLHLLSVLTH